MAGWPWAGVGKCCGSKDGCAHDGWGDVGGPAGPTRSEIRVLTGEFLEYPVASFSVLASLAEAEVPVEGEVFVGAKMKIRDVAEVLLVDERPRRTIRVSDAGSPEGASSCTLAGKVAANCLWSNRGIS